MAARFSFDASKSLRRAAASFNHVAAANGLSAVRSMDEHFPGRVVRPIGGGEAVADLIRSASDAIRVQTYRVVDDL